MAKVNKEEAKKRLDTLGAELRTELAKDEYLQFRVDKETIERIHAKAIEQKKRVGPMLREWIIERLDQEDAGTTVNAEMARRFEELRIMDKRLNQLELCVENLLQVLPNREPELITFSGNSWAAGTANLQALMQAEMCKFLINRVQFAYPHSPAYVPTQVTIGSVRALFCPSTPPFDLKVTETGE